MNNYLKLIQANTPYAKRMTRLSNRIFGNVVRTTDSSSMKVVKMFSEEPIYMKESVINYYPRHRELSALIKVLRHHGLFRDEHEDFKEEMRRLRSEKGIKKERKSERALNEEKRKSTSTKDVNPLEKIPLRIHVELK